MERVKLKDVYIKGLKIDDIFYIEEFGIFSNIRFSHKFIKYLKREKDIEINYSIINGADGLNWFRKTIDMSVSWQNEEDIKGDYSFKFIDEYKALISYKRK